MRDDLIERLKELYGCDEPIMAAEILSAWNEYSRPMVFRLLKRYTESGSLARFDTGIYYIPTDTFLGKSKLDPQKVINKRFIESGGDVFGYYAGMGLFNGLGLTTQVPMTAEIVTEKETTRVRKVMVGKAKVLLRRAKTNINKSNAPALQFLEAMKFIYEPLDEYQVENLREFVRLNNVKEKDVLTYSNLFPKRAMENLRRIGAKNVFAQ
ncbi:hypothetical protein FACS1894211_14670 [Clostridia bacterium]|nr:hypothetical protein FACS1894211_14670 [Clostridia bacterium]